MSWAPLVPLCNLIVSTKLIPSKLPHSLEIPLPPLKSKGARLPRCKRRHKWRLYWKQIWQKLWLLILQLVKYWHFCLLHSLLTDYPSKGMDPCCPFLWGQNAGNSLLWVGWRQMRNRMDAWWGFGVWHDEDRRRWGGVLGWKASTNCSWLWVWWVFDELWGWTDECLTSGKALPVSDAFEISTEVTGRGACGGHLVWFSRSCVGESQMVVCTDSWEQYLLRSVRWIFHWLSLGPCKAWLNYSNCSH